tara:strand:+ start:165 stop:392 length:228 start_codon:yes stop_codon:yes gene_type:complete
MPRKKRAYKGCPIVPYNKIKVGMTLQTFSCDGAPLYQHEVLRVTRTKEGVDVLLDNGTPEGTVWDIRKGDGVYEA